MKIVNIFATHLFAFQYSNVNEFDRLMDLWTDVKYLQTFAKANNFKNKEDIFNFVNEILKNAEQIQDLIDNLITKNLPLNNFFQPLQFSENEYRISLPLQKGKIRSNKLRLYAIKIDNNCYVITGGAIKMSQKMEGHLETASELEKLKKAKSYLKSKGVFDEDSFFELLNE